MISTFQEISCGDVSIRGIRSSYYPANEVAKMSAEDTKQCTSPESWKVGSGWESGIGSNPVGIYELAPGAVNWRYFAPSSGGYPRIFLWNSAGHLAVIWGERGSPSITGFQYRLF
jgi:hypothetical protein